jgi:hypothetical protein
MAMLYDTVRFSMSDSAGTTFTVQKEVRVFIRGILPETRLATPLSAPLLLVSNFKLKQFVRH